MKGRMCCWSICVSSHFFSLRMNSGELTEDINRWFYTLNWGGVFKNRWDKHSIKFWANTSCSCFLILQRIRSLMGGYWMFNWRSFVFDKFSWNWYRSHRFYWFRSLGNIRRNVRRNMLKQGWNYLKVKTNRYWASCTYWNCKGNCRSFGIRYHLNQRWIWIFLWRK